MGFFLGVSALMGVITGIAAAVAANAKPPRPFDWATYPTTLVGWVALAGAAVCVVGAIRGWTFPGTRRLAPARSGTSAPAPSGSPHPLVRAAQKSFAEIQRTADFAAQVIDPPTVETGLFDPSTRRRLGDHARHGRALLAQAPQSILAKPQPAWITNLAKWRDDAEAMLASSPEAVRNFKAATPHTAFAPLLNGPEAQLEQQIKVLEAYARD